MTKYDSTDDVLLHKSRVTHYIQQFCEEMIKRALVHDQSKLEEPEKSVFDSAGDRLKGFTYGSPGYKASLEDLKPALDHHYSVNSHHPEHYPNGVAGMDLYDLVEMFCDWRASSERNKGGFQTNLNIEKHEIKAQLSDIIENHRSRYHGSK